MKKSDKNKNEKPDFEAIKRFSPYETEYWSARELGNLLGYDSWRNFEAAIKRAMTSCRQTGQNVEEHFVKTNSLVELGSGSNRDLEDYLLSRYACYLIAQNGDPRKLEIALAQQYFIVSTRENELRQLKEDQEKRLQLRERMVEGNKRLAEAAHNAGVLSRNFGAFQNAGYRGLYDELNVEDIKNRKGIGQKEELLDRMGWSELAANDLRAALTEERLKKDGIVGQARASETHHEVGYKIRKAIADIGATMPEDLPAEPSIKPLLQESQRRKRKSLSAESKKETGQTKLFD